MRPRNTRYRFGKCVICGKARLNDSITLCPSCGKEFIDYKFNGHMEFKLEDFIKYKEFTEALKVK